MGCPDRIGVLTNHRRRASFGSRARLLSHRVDCTEDDHRNKRSRQQEEEVPFGLFSSIAESRRCWSEGKAKATFELPPPSPLKRPVQGPHRPTTFRKTRVDKQLEQEWTRQERCYTTCDLNSLKSYKQKIDALRVNFASAGGNQNDIDWGGIAIEDETVAIDIDRGGNAIEDERVAIDTCTGGIEIEGEGIASDSGSFSSTPIVAVEVERNSERESEREEDKAPEEGEPLYKRLLEKVRKDRDFKLKTLDMEIELATVKFGALQVTTAKYKEEKQDENESLIDQEKQVALHDALAPLKDEDEADVARVLKGRNRREVLVMHESSNIEITRQALECLMPGAWLNDEVINLYFELLKERENREPKKFLKCHFFNTFFYKKLYNKTRYDYKAVRRWTTQRKIGYSLTDCDKIFVPIHKEIHWCLAIIDMRAKKFQYLDSLKGSDAHVLEVLAKYIVDEAKDKMGQDLDVSNWEKEFVEELPAQRNGWDCGVFMIKYADFHSQGLPLSFSQANMPYFRKRTAKEILELRAE